MYYNEAFVQEVRANPQADAPRLIFADYLEEEGDPLSEFIRVQVQLSQPDCVGPARAPLEIREKELLGQYAEGWLGPLRELGAEGVSTRCFQRGLIERIRIRSTKFMKNGEEICRISPALHVLDLRAPDKGAQRLLKYKMPKQITSLDLSANGLGEPRGGNADDTEETSELMNQLCQAAWLPQIRELNLQFNRLGEAGMAALSAVEFRQLTALWLDVNKIDAGAIQLLAGSDSFKHLQKLSLKSNLLGDPGAKHLAKAKNLQQLEFLDLSSNRIGNPGAKAIAESKTLGSLKTLLLRANQIKKTGYEHLAKAQFPQLEHLDIRNNNEAPTTTLKTKYKDGLVA